MIKTVLGKNYKDKDFVSCFSVQLLELIKKNKALEKDICIYSVGTDLVVGDSFAPLLGTILVKNNKLKNIKISGTLENLNHGNVVSKNYKALKNKYSDSFIIAIDASIGNNVGEIILKESSLKPGKGLGKDISPVGDISILSIVSSNKDTLMNNGVRLGFIYDIVTILEKTIVNLDKMIEKERKQNKIKKVI